jgi:hypothetical protein
MRRRGAIGAIVCSRMPCRRRGGRAVPHQRRIRCYDKWLVEFEREATAAGVLQLAIAAAALYLIYDQRIVKSY